MTRLGTLLALSLSISLAPTGFAQNSQSYLNDVGSPAYSVNIPVENGFIDVSNGNLHLEFPLASPAQRGALSVSERMVYDSRIWMFSPFGTHGSYHWWPYNVPGSSTSSGGWRLVNGNEIGTVSYPNTYENDTSCGGYRDDGSDSGLMDYYTRSSIAWTDPSGTLHNFSAQEIVDNNECSGSSNVSDNIQGGQATDGSAYTIPFDSNGNIRVIDGNGTQVYPSIIDRFGNYLSADGQGNLVDSGGHVPVIATQNGNVTYYDVLAPNGPINNNGARVRYTVTSASVPVATQFNQSDTYEWNPSVQYLTPVQSIGLPDGTQYSFTYDSYGGLQSVTLPTGGVASYGYSNFVDSSNTSNRWLASRTADNGTTTITPSVVASCPNYSTGCIEQVNVQKPSGDETVYQLTLINGAWNTGVSVYAGSASNGEQLSNQIAVNNYTNGCTSASCSGANYIIKSLSTTTLFPTGVQSQSQSVFDATTGRPSAVKQWDFIAPGQTFSSTPTRETDYTYTGYDPQQVTLVNQSGQQVSQTTYGYTSTATATSGITQHGAVNAGGPYLQTVSQWIDTTGGTLDQTSIYDDTGTLLSSTGPTGTTTYGHDGTNIFTTSVAPPVPTSGISLTTSATYDPSSGALLTQTNANGAKTVYSGFDALSRATEIDVQDSNSNIVAKTTYSYSINQVGVHSYQSASVSGDTETLYDAYGRPSRTAVYNGQGSNPWYQQDACYDSSGRPNFQSTAYQGSGWGTAKVCSGSNVGTSSTYDALGRLSSVTNVDGTAQYSYAGRAVKQIDVNGVQTITQMDAFGQTTAVCEISSNSLAGESPVGCGMDIAGTGYVTNYAYNLANTTMVSQGAQSRTFKTDSLGRLVFTSEPERGTTTYSYNYVSGSGLQVIRARPRANQMNAATLTHTTTQYDSLGRVVQISYDDGTVPKSFYYDAAPSSLQWSTAPQNTKGLLAGTLTGSGSSTTRSQFSYDFSGHVTTMWQCAPSICGTASQEGRPALQFGYDLAGDLTYEFDAVSGGISYGRSPAGEVTSITNQNYTDQTSMPNLVSSVVNGPFGATNWTWGNGNTAVQNFDAPSGRLFGRWLCRGNGGTGSPIACNNNSEMHGFIYSQKGAQITGMCDDVLGCAGNGYDEFNRLSSTSGGGNLNFSYTYDRYGNRLQQTGSPSTTFLFDPATNRNTSFTYDAAGNQANDGYHNYTYDAEGNVLGVDGGQTARYAYDAFNRRIQQGDQNATEEDVYDPFGHRLSTWLLASDTPVGLGVEARIYWGDTLIANRSWNGQTYLHHADWLGTERLRTDYQGNEANRVISYAFGDGFSTSNSDGAGAGQDNNYFAGLDFDGESGTDHAQFRQYAPTQGRWMSPDPYDGSYNLSNPQSLNRYSYVENVPLTFRDPSGLDGCSTSTAVYCIVGPGATASGDSDFGANVFVDVAIAFVDIGQLVNGWLSHAKFTASHDPKPCSAAPSPFPHGVAGVVGGEASLGLSKLGATAQGSAGFGLFGGKPGGFFSYVATKVAGSSSAGAPYQGAGVNPIIVGGGVGVGGGLLITNATSVQQTSGLFQQFTLSLPGASFSFAYGGGIYTLSGTVGPGLAVSTTSTTTNTKVKGPC